MGSIFGGIEQGRIFDQAAELLFCDVMVCSFARGQVAHGFVFHLEAVQLHDAKEFFTGFPNLPLLQLHFGQDTSATGREQFPL